MNIQRTPKPLRIIWIVGFLLGISTIPSFATVTIEAKVEKNVLRVGEQTRLEIAVISDGEQISQNPTLPTIDGINFVYVNQSSSQQFQFINGQGTSRIEIDFIYDVFALKEGKFTVSDIAVSSSAGSVKANSFEITVFPGTQPIPTRQPLLSAPQGAGNLNLYLLSDTNKKEVYKGEEVIFSYDAVYHQQWKRWFDQAIIRNGEYAAFNEEKGALKDFLVDTVDLKFQQDVKPVRMAGSMDLFFQKSLRRYVLFPLTPGEYSIVPMTVEFALPIQRVTTFPVKPEPIKLVVKPLPAEGKPDIFEGAVGSFNLKAEAEPLELSEGDTVTLKVSLDGIGNIKNAPKPVLPDLTKFDQFDPTQKENISVTESGMRGQIDFSYVLIPHDVHSNTIGPVRYAYFDPAQGKYNYKETPPITLTIHPSSNKNSRTGSNVAFNRRLITRVGNDFRFIVTTSEGTSIVVLALYKSSIFWIVAISPGVILLLTGIWKWRNEFLAARPTVAKSIKAPKLAKKFLTDARKAIQQKDLEGVYIKLGKAITDFIDHRWNLASAGMTTLELQEALIRKGVQENHADSVVRILAEFDSARFSGATQNAERIQVDFAKTEELLGELMKTKRS